MIIKEVINIGLKAVNLNSMVNRGLNIHDFREITPLSAEDLISELEHYYIEHKFFSVRTDTFSSNNKDLPFLFIDDNLYEKMDDVHTFAEMVVDLNLSCIFASAREFDKFLIANVVVTLEDENIIIELSTKKVPLREMYKYPSEISSFVGTIFTKISKFKCYGAQPQLDIDILEEIVQKIFSKCGSKETYFELSVYSQKVGIFHDNIVFWHIS